MLKGLSHEGSVDVMVFMEENLCSFMVYVHDHNDVPFQQCRVMITESTCYDIRQLRKISLLTASNGCHLSQAPLIEKKCYENRFPFVTVERFRGLASSRFS